MQQTRHHLLYATTITAARAGVRDVRVAAAAALTTGGGQGGAAGGGRAVLGAAPRGRGRHPPHLQGEEYYQIAQSF